MNRLQLWYSERHRKQRVYPFDPKNRKISNPVHEDLLLQKESITEKE